jgi:maltose/moltooligosaccharide transporter
MAGGVKFDAIFAASDMIATGAMRALSEHGLDVPNDIATFGFDDLPALWVAAPLTGLLVQPLIGHFSDRIWLGRLGRRRPYFLAGALLAALSLFIITMAHVLLFAAIMLWVLDALINISMEPYRAFVGDMLNKGQHTSGYAVQTALIGVGAVAGSLLPDLFNHLKLSNTALAETIPDTVLYSFWVGGAAMLLAVSWTMAFTAIVMALAALAMLRVQEPEPE